MDDDVDLEALSRIVRFWRWLDDWRSGLPVRKIALREKLTVRRIQQGIAQAMAYEAEAPPSIKIHREIPPPAPNLEPLFPMGGIYFTPTTPCPKHPGKQHPNPRYRRWRSKMVCMVCHRSGQDARIKRDPINDTKPDPKPPETKPQPQKTRREKRKQKYGNQAKMTA